MFELIGLAIGGFVGYLSADFLSPLDPVRHSARGLIAAGVSQARALLGNFNSNPLVLLGAGAVFVLLVLWLLGFSSALLFGAVLGLIYKEEIGRLPFVESLASSVKSKLSGPR